MSLQISSFFWRWQGSSIPPPAILYLFLLLAVIKNKGEEREVKGEQGTNANKAKSVQMRCVKDRAVSVEERGLQVGTGELGGEE